MLLIHFFAILGILILGLCCLEAECRRGRLSRLYVVTLFYIALILRLFAASLSEGFGNDTACFASWADRIFQLGPGEFYSPDVFTDYPPGYMYVLWILGAIRKLFALEYYSVPHLILLKVPAIVCDLACGYLVLKEARKKCTDVQAFFLCAAFLFNPAVILNSSVWGQVDSVFTLCVACMCLSLVRRKMLPAYVSFALGVLVKPQTLLFGPILLAGILDHVFLKDFSWKKFFKNLLQGLASIGGLVLAVLPFGFLNVWEQYFNTVGSYPYAAVNAYNLWGFLGKNWVSQEETFLGIPYVAYGMAAIAATVILVFVLSLRRPRDREKYPFLAALLVISIFVLSVRMHERYMYPGLLLLLLAYVYKPSRLTYLCYGGFSILHFYNTCNVLFFYDPASYDRKAAIILLVSGGMLAGEIFLCFLAWKLYGKAGGETILWHRNTFQDTGKSGVLLALEKKLPLAPRPSRKQKPLGRADFLCMAAVTLVYSCFALYDLGDMQAPESAYDMTQGQSVELDFGSQAPASLAYYIAPWHGRVFTLEGRADSTQDWTNLGEITLRNVFTWQTEPINGGMQQLRLTLQDNQASLLELVFLDENGSPLLPTAHTAYQGLFDETDLYPGVSTFRNSMYFDEIYHGRTAYEFVHGLTSYENTHPPLGKIFIALGTLVFGMNPFGWRIAGTLFGIAMVPLIYLFARKISGYLPLALLASTLFAFDFMHFAQTRIATIDVYITFFVLLMYYFMYQYMETSFYDTPLKKTWIPLGACGLCMGLGVASKWTGVYAGVGLALIFFSVLFRRYREYLYAQKNPAGRTEGIQHKHIVERFLPHTRKTIRFCLVFFVAIPALIYLLSYLPFRDYGDRWLLSRMIHNQGTMFEYHSGLEATHDFASPWHEWPSMKRPIWYYSRIVTGVYKEGGLREGISSFGNPAVWWLGIPAALYMIYLWWEKKDRTAAFLFVGYLAQYLPWFFVTRITFIYHYFPSVVFVVLMIMYSLLQWKSRMEKHNRRAFPALLLVYGAAAVGLFLLFYPVLSGQPVEAAFVDKYLRWFPDWVLTHQ